LRPSHKRQFNLKLSSEIYTGGTRHYRLSSIRRPGRRALFRLYDVVCDVGYNAQFRALVVGNQDAYSPINNGLKVANNLLTHCPRGFKGSIPEKGSSEQVKAGSSTSDRAILSQSPPLTSVTAYKPRWILTVSSFNRASNSSSRSLCCCFIPDVVKRQRLPRTANHVAPST